MKSSSWPGIEVTLCSDGINLNEYDVGVSPSQKHRLSGFVESTEKQIFSIEAKIEPSFRFATDDLLFKVYIDGDWVGGVYSWKTTGTRVLTMNGSYSSDACGNGQLRRFTFAKLETSEGHATPELGRKLKDLGKIDVRIYRCKPSAPHHEAVAPANLRESIVPEKALKGRALSNRASLAVPETHEELQSWDCTFPWGKHPVLIISFNYRSRKDLQIERFIPRSPTPVPLEARDPATLTLEEALEVIKIQRQRSEAMMQAHIVVKREKSTGAKENDPELDEVMPRAAKRARIGAPMIMDISED